MAFKKCQQQLLLRNNVYIEAERKLKLCHYQFAVGLICFLCHMWAAINKKSCWQEDLNSLIQLCND